MFEIRFDLPFKEQLEYFGSKGFVLSPESWRDVWQAAHSRAFTVARVTAMDVVADIREAVDASIKNGTTLKQFKAGLRETLERKGWLAPAGERAQVTLPDGTVRKRLTGWRLDTIYATNMQEGYSVGRYRQQEEVKTHRPYWMYMTAGDVVVRPSHAAMHGKVFHADHPVWREWYPPNGFECRCYTRTLSGRDLEREGLEEQKAGVAVKPDEGWNYNPGKEGLRAWKPEMGRYSAAERKLLTEALGPALRP